MAYNLLKEPWIPVRTSRGYRERIAPWQITAGIRGDPVVALDSPRPDFNGALIQFLIGLLQTSALAPETELDWQEGLDSPPGAEELQTAFSPLEHVFNLDGDFPRFLQDFTMEDGHEVPITDLLIDVSGNGHFIKPKDGHGFCFACAAVALFCLHTNSPEGGRGHLTGIRGGGPLTSLVIPTIENFWHTLWLNVVLQEDMEPGPGLNSPGRGEDIFPWLAPTRTGDAKTGQLTYPEDAHPLQMYWSMPRRIRLDCTELGEGFCDVCGQASDRLVQRYFTRPYGVNYAGNWVHPLTSYAVDKQGVHLSRKARPGSINYRNWIGLVLKSPNPDENAKTIYLPARVVQLFTEERRHHVGNRATARLWGFGYDMEHMRARCWFEGRMPIPEVPDERISEEYVKCSERMVKAAITIGGYLATCIKEAQGKTKAKGQGDAAFVSSVYWSSSEPVFFEHLDALIKELQGSYPEFTHSSLKAWHTQLCRLALKLFDEYAAAGNIENEDPARIARARNKLRNWNRGKEVTEKILHIPKEPR